MEADLIKVVEQISPPSAKIAYIRVGISLVVQVHHGDGVDGGRLHTLVTC